MFQRSLNLLFALVFAGPIYAHEFWISPVDFEVDVQSPIAAHFRVGQEFKGGSHSYLSRYTTRHELHQGGAILEMSPREGDRPAMQYPGLEDGLAVLVHETTDSTLTYREFDKFVNFIKHKDFEGLPEAHLARGLPEVGFVESYRRFAKSLRKYRKIAFQPFAPVRDPAGRATGHRPLLRAPHRYLRLETDLCLPKEFLRQGAGRFQFCPR